MRHQYLPCVAWQRAGEEAVIVDLDSGDALGLNRTGSFIWSRLETRTLAEIAEELSRTFEVAPGTAKEDVSSFVEEMRARGLVELCP
jgi:hypothetical protein